jgi:hypothetical protein
MLKRILSLGIAAPFAALSPVAAQQRPDVRPLGPVVATSTETFGPMVFIQHGAGGVIVNDPMNRRLLKLDESMANPVVIADSTPATANAYSGRSGALLAYRGDSTLFVDPGSYSMLVIDPAGKIARVMSVPRTQDAMVLGNTPIGGAAYDGAGRIVYRGFGMPRFEMRRGPDGTMIGGAPQMPDSGAIVRVDLASRQVDTIAWVRIPRPKIEMDRDTLGTIRPRITMNPLPTIDEWAVLRNGSIAIVRGHDYHVEFVRPDGTRESAPKIPFEWQRLTDEDKAAFLDSLQAARERFLASQPAPAQPQVSSSTTTGAGGERRVQTMVMAGPGPGAAAAAAGGNPLAGLMMSRNVNFVRAEELPDYKPPFFAGSVRADADGNLWVLTIPTKAVAGGSVYDVINGKGELIDRVQLPGERLIVGFGAGGIVYLAAREGATTKLEKAKIELPVRTP